MLKVKATILGNDNKLVGVMVDFDDKANPGPRPVYFTAPNFAQVVNATSNFEYVGNKLVPKTKTGLLSELPMVNANGQPISNEMTLVKRIISDNELQGFEVKFGYMDKPQRVKYADVITLANVFKPVNFMVRKREKTQKEYLAGKGIMLDSLPSETLFTDKTKVKQNMHQGVAGVRGTTDLETAKNVGKLGADLINLYSVLTEAEASVFTISKEYNRTTAKTQSVGSDFMPFGQTFIGSAELKHSKDKMKANIQFKQPGLVNVPSLGPNLTYVFKEMTLFKNGTNNMTEIGVAIPVAKANLVQAYLRSCGSLITIAEFTDDTTKKAAAGLMGTKVDQLLFLKLNLTGMALMSKETEAKSILTTDQIGVITQNVQSNTIVVKALKYKLKELEAKHGKTYNTILPKFASFADGLKQEIVDAGIDLYSGSYTEVEKNKGTTEADAKAAKVVDDALFIEYAFTDLNKFGTRKADELWNKATEGINLYIDTMVQNAKDLEAKCATEVDYLNKLNGLIKNYTVAINKNRHLLWLHKMAMLQATDMKAVHTHDKKAWTPISTRSKGKVCFTAQTKIGILTLTMCDALSL